MASTAPDFDVDSPAGSDASTVPWGHDDQSSTFIVPKGASYQVIFCPGGRSTNIIANNDKAGGTTSKASVGKKSALMAGGSLIVGIAWGGVVWAGFWVAMFVTCGVGG
ncbi:unnamed protein product [Zymoseptoria tritici ST99CH_3D7]|uniref:Uncharacterized protein n=1 Tax=Zymoseptoria tritici (strain ST99CH_3D7) TaxID=1276538 RepID=A0A1X7RLN2_ZYMT9|nr:unnamed protein product [Zymoseptoria tritici ST99CH_3D7]